MKQGDLVNLRQLKISDWKKKGVVNFDGSNLETNLKAALILPDGKPDTLQAW